MAIDRGHRVFLFVVLMATIFAVPVFAGPQLKVESPAKQVATGKSVLLKIQLEWPQTEGPYEFNSLEPKLENLTLTDQRQSQETGETVSQTFLYEFRPVKTGTAVIYPFEISYRKAETEPWAPLLIPEQTIKVVSDFPLKVALIGLFTVLGLSAAVALGFRQWDLGKTREALKNAPPPDPKQRIYAQAEEGITKFNASDPKEKLTYWSDQLRTVVVTYYDISSSTATSAEVLAFLKVKGIPTGEWNEISRIFGQLAEMQFSQRYLSAVDLDQMRRTLLQYIAGKIIIGAL
jgi:hypothetical protein